MAYIRPDMHIQIQFHPDGISRSRRCSFFRGARPQLILTSAEPGPLPQGGEGLQLFARLISVVGRYKSPDIYWGNRVLCEDQSLNPTKGTRHRRSGQLPNTSSGCLSIKNSANIVTRTKNTRKAFVTQSFALNTLLRTTSLYVTNEEKAQKIKAD